MWCRAELQPSCQTHKLILAFFYCLFVKIFYPSNATRVERTDCLRDSVMFPVLSSKLVSLERKTIEIWMPFPSSLPSTSGCWNAELRQTTNLEHSEIKRLLVSLLLIGREFRYNSLHVWLHKQDSMEQQFTAHYSICRGSLCACTDLLSAWAGEKMFTPQTLVVCTYPQSFFSLSVTWKQRHSPLFLPGIVHVNIDRQLKAGVLFYEVYMYFAKCSSSLAHQ